MKFQSAKGKKNFVVEKLWVALTFKLFLQIKILMKYGLLFLFLCSFLTSTAQEQWTVAASEKFQNTINKEYADRAESPLTDEDFKVFTSLEFFPISEQYVVKAKFIKAENEKVFKMKTTGTRLPEYVKYGTLYFTLEGRNFQLNVYQNVELTKKSGYHDYLFLPFSDLSCGKESYIGGRYIDMKLPKGDSVLIDFNTAYNPYCAYNHKYSCPIVPLENDLNSSILAGVKKFHN